jgi:hypothetical protein
MTGTTNGKLCVFAFQISNAGNMSKKNLLYLRLGQKRWRDPETAELLRHRLQRAYYGAGGSGPPAAVLLGGAPAAVGLGSGASGWGSCGRGARRRHKRAGLALALLGGASVAARLDAGVEGRGSGGSGPQCWRQRGSCGFGVEGGDDSAVGDNGVEGGDGKSRSLTAKNQIFHRELEFHISGLLPFIPGDYSYRLE